MGYTTEFEGAIEVKPNMNENMRNKLLEFSDTCHTTQTDPNLPKELEYSSWCDWVPTEEGDGIEWNGAEKFYNAADWMQYIITNILAPEEYKCNGEIQAQGEEMHDRWKLVVKDNVVKVIQDGEDAFDPEELRRRIRKYINECLDISKKCREHGATSRIIDEGVYLGRAQGASEVLRMIREMEEGE